MILMKFPILETSRFRLREVTFEDTAHVFHYFSDEEVVQYYGLEPFLRSEQANEFITQVQNGFKNGTIIRWAIAKKENDEMLGTIGFHNWSKMHHRAEIGYELKKEEWRKGIMTEVLETVLPFAFEQLGLNRIGATVRKENRGSRELLHKFGFTEEGNLQEYQYYLGKYYDLLMYGLVSKKYPQRKTGKL